MLCPDCGIHFPAGRTACAVCGAELRDAPKAVLVLAQPTPSKRDPLEDSLWPPPTVFILDEDEEDAVLEMPELSAVVFEDAQADDVFEQSLSGVKLEDLVDEDEEVLDSTSEPLPTPIEEQPREPIEASIDPSRSPEQAVVEDFKQNGYPEAIDVSALLAAAKNAEPANVPEPIDLKEPEPDAAASTGRKTFRAFAAVLAFSAVFSVGAGSGFWYREFTAQNVVAAQVVTEPQPEEAKPAIPTQPDGMVYVPGGDFLMGSDDGEVLSRPAHFVSVRPFFIDRTEVTNEQYRNFVEATGYDPPPTWKDGAIPPGDEALPVTAVTWYDAAAYAAWAGKRLPTEPEWEFAARGAEGRKYPWGNDWDATLANVENRTNGLMRVGETAASPLGINEMAGNAWEWTANDARPYPGGKEFPWSRLKLKIIRGGNWKSSNETAASTFRGYYGASGEKDYSSTSFRCVKDIAN